MDRATATRAYAGVLGRAALHIEPAGNLLRDPDGEAVAGGLKQPAPLDFVLERLALGLGALQRRVGVAECVWQALRLRDCGNGMW